MIKPHDYEVRVEPHLTDYAGVVWHGSYLRWLEEARIDALRQVGLEYSELVRLGCDLPVIRLELNYCRPLRMGDLGIVKSQIIHRDRVRLVWEQNVYILQQDPKTPSRIALEAKVTLVPVDMEKKKILRQLPLSLSHGLDQLMLADLG
jgi:acyl-CoA thioester hydrolase